MMGEVKVFVGNVNFHATKDDLADFFGDCKSIKEIAIIEDKETGNSKGFAFILFGNEDDAQDAVEKMNGKDFQGRHLKVKVAENQENNRTFEGFQSGRENFRNYERAFGGGYGDMGHGVYGNGGGYGHSGGYSHGGVYGHRGGYAHGDYAYDQRRYDSGYGGYGGGDYRGGGGYYRGDRGSGGGYGGGYSHY